MFRSFIAFICELLSLAIFVRVVLSWFPVGWDNPVKIFLYKVTEPILDPLRRAIPRTGALDLSPLAAIVILQIISSLVK